MKAHEVPSTLFDKLAIKFEQDGPKRERFTIEDSTEADVICLGDDMWISCSIHTFLGVPGANFRLWPRKPERESDLVGAPSPIFTVYGGLVGDGIWSYGRGDKYVTKVVVDYGYFSKIDLTSERWRYLLEVASGILSIASKLAADVECETHWDAASAT